MASRPGRRPPLTRPLSRKGRGGRLSPHDQLVAQHEAGLLPRAGVDVLDAAEVRDIWQKHLAGRMNAASILWNVLMLADWRERFKAVC